MEVLMKIIRTISLTLMGVVVGSAVQAQNTSVNTSPKSVQPWMHPGVGAAWRQGYLGQGVSLTVVDDFSSTRYLLGKMTKDLEMLRHGQWTLKEAGLVAPSATLLKQDFNAKTKVGLSSGLNVVNLSYGMFAAAGYKVSSGSWSAQESSLIGYAKNGQALIAKAAGNDAVAIGSANAYGKVDYLNVALRGAQSAIFVGALKTNGTSASRASLASYSNTPGADVVIQKQFLLVGVDGAKTGLNGTSFAAPIVSGYSAILGSKFTQSNPTQIANQLLSTARQDTVANYKASKHGRGEASITRALAPLSIQ